MEKTKLGLEKISLGLIGRNQRYVVLKKPKKLAYPDGNEVQYSDSFLSRLCDLYSFEEIFGDKKKDIAKGKQNAICPIVMGSPLRNSEGEDVLAYMLMSSAQAGNWQPFIINVPELTDTNIKTAEEYLNKIDTINPDYNKGRINAGVLFGIAKAKMGRFALPVKYKENVIVVPSQEFVEYCVERKQKTI